MPTVEQVWRQALPPGTELVAGEAGLYGEVSWVVTLKPAPPGFESLKGGEFALVGARVAMGLGVPLPHLVSSLGERGASAIAFLGEVTPEARERAEALGLPLLLLPPQSHLPILETRAARLITEERLHLYHRERELNQALMELALAGRGVAAILAQLGELTSRAAGLLDRDFEPLSPLPQEVTDRLEELRRQALSGSHPGRSPTPAQPPVTGLKLGAGLAGFLAPVLVGQRVEGYLLLVAPKDELEEADRLAVRVGALALAVEMARRRAAEETEDRLQAEVVEALLSGDFPSPQVITERAKRQGLDISRPCVAMAAQVENSPYRREAIGQEVAAVLPEARYHYRGETLVVLQPVAPGTAAAELRRLGKETSQGLSARLQGMVSLGIGRLYPGPEGVRLSFQEAERALTMGVRLFGKGSVTFFADLGVYRLLFSLPKGGELEAFYQEHLGRLLEYDRRRGGELVRTLEARLRHATIAETAQALHIHRNTLLYRLQRIQEIAGLDLGDGETRLSLYLALRAGETLKALG